jgi:hypothetical protein
MSVLDFFYIIVVVVAMKKKRKGQNLIVTDFGRYVLQIIGLLAFCFLYCYYNACRDFSIC